MQLILNIEYLLMARKRYKARGEGPANHCRILRLVFSICLLVGALAACGSAPFREGKRLAADGQLDVALPKLREATLSEPENADYHAHYLRVRDAHFARLMEKAALAKKEGKISEAEKIYLQILNEDPHHQRAKDGLLQLARDARHVKVLAEVEMGLKRQEFELAEVRLKEVLQENPEQEHALRLRRALDEKYSTVSGQAQLLPGLKKPLTIEFRETPIRQIFEIFSRTSGLNFVFDRDVKGDQRTTIFLRNTSVLDALNLILLTNQLEYRVLDQSSILIYPNSVGKNKEYQALSVKTFLLSNVDAKTAGNTLKTILKVKELVIDEKQNLIVMRDTPDAIRMAEKLIAVQDQAEPEVMLDVAILEVSRKRLVNLGVQWPNQVALAPLAGSSGVLTLADLQNLSSQTIGAVVPPVTLRAEQQDGSVNILANPRIRARNRETAKVMIGDRIPNVTSTSTATGFVSENIQYVDVGLKLEVQPTVNADNEVAIKIALEVSSVANQTQTKSGSLAYQIGTRNASTLLKLKDGENQILAGLIRNEESTTGNRLPWIGDIPILGHLFGSQRDDANKTEIVLSITPRLIRNARRPDFNLLEFESGTEMNIKPTARLVPRRATDLASGASSTSAQTGPGIPVGEAETPAKVSNQEPVAQGNETPTTVALQGDASVKVGNPFKVRVNIDPREPVTSIPMALSFDPKVVEVVSVTEGEVMKQGGAETRFAHRVDRNAGQLFVTSTRLGKDGANLSGMLLEVELRPLVMTRESRLVITAIAPVGIGGRSANANFPEALVFAVGQ